MPRLKACVGISAKNASLLDGSLKQSLRALAAEKTVAAIGSCGLDDPDDEAQADALRFQASLAHELKLKLIVKATSAPERALRIIEEAGLAASDVLAHGFAAGPDGLQPWVDAGCHVSFNAKLADNPDLLRTLVAAMPVERVLLESGAPDETLDLLAGYPARPDQVVFAAEAIADICPADQLFRNALDFFGL